MIFNLGAPSQLDTFDMKPDAPAEIRGPFKPISTASPDIQISEIFPLHAKHRRQVLARPQSCYHTAAAVHDTGHQMMQTGPAVHRRRQHAARRLRAAATCAGRKTDLPAHVILPEPMGRTGGNLPHGQDAGFLGKAHDPFVADGRSVASRTSRCPTCCRPREIGEARLERRRKLRDDRRRDGEELRGQRGRPAAGQQLRGGLPADDQHAGPRGVRPDEGAAEGPRALRHEPLRPVLPAGPAAGRGGRAVRHDQHVPHRVRRDHLGHPRLASRSRRSRA